MDLQGLSSTASSTAPSPGFAYTAANLRPSPPSSCSPGNGTPVPSPVDSGSAHSSPTRVVPPVGTLSQSPPTDPYSPMASDFRGLTVGWGRPAPARGPLNAVGWPIVGAVGANSAAAGAPDAPWRMPDAYETAVSRFTAQAIDSPFTARLPFDIMANDFLPVPPIQPAMPANQLPQPTPEELLLRKHEQMLQQLDAQRLQDQLRLQQEQRQAQQVQQLRQQEWRAQSDMDQSVQLQQQTQWLEQLVESEEGEEERRIEATPTFCEEPTRTPSRWQQQCHDSQDYLARSLESDEESELMAIMSQESSQDDEKPTDESACWKLAHPSWPRLSSISEGIPVKGSSRHGGKRRARDAAAAATAAAAPESCAALSAEQQRNFRRFQERHPIEMTAESIDDYLFKSMNAERERGGSKGQAKRL